MKLGIVTTFSDKGFDEYGKYFVESCKKFVDKNITIYFYTDNKQLEPRDNFVLRNLESSIPDLTEFKKRNGHKQPKKFLYDAVRFSHKSYCIYHAAKNNNVSRLIHTSTSEVYGTAQYVPIDEKHPLQPQSPYSATKIAADAMVTSFYNSFDLPVTIARPFNTYGPRQSDEL